MSLVRGTRNDATRTGEGGGVDHLSAETHVFIVAFPGWTESDGDTDGARKMKFEADVEIERFEISAELWGIQSRQHSRLKSVFSTSSSQLHFPTRVENI